MRIVVWNCCRGPFAKKLAALETLSPDVAVISEAICPLEETSQVLWFPSDSSLGIQVRASGPYRLARLPAAQLPNCVVPVHVTGPDDFTLLAVWTWPAPSYIKAFLNGLAAYAALLGAGPAVVAGDYNGNPMFDKPGRGLKWSAGFSTLCEAGLVSAYHHVHGTAYGAESTPRTTSCASPNARSTSTSASCRRPGRQAACMRRSSWARVVLIERSLSAGGAHPILRLRGNRPRRALKGLDLRSRSQFADMKDPLDEIV